MNVKDANLLKIYTKGFSKNVFWGLFCACFYVIFILLLPQVTQLFIDSLYSFSGTETKSTSILWLSLSNFLALFDPEHIVILLCVVFLILAILKNLASFFLTRNFFKIASVSAGNLRKDGFKKIAFLDKNISLNEVYFSFTSDIDDFYRCINSLLPKIFISILTICLAIISTAFISLSATVIIIVFIPLIILIGFIYYKKQNVQTLFEESREKRRQMFLTSEDMLENIKEIKNYGTQENAIEKYNKLIENHKNSKTKSNKFTYRIELYMNIVKAICIGLVVSLAGYACFKGKLSVGYFVLLISYMLYILNSTTTFMSNIFDYKFARVGIKNLTNFLEQETLIKNQSLKAEKFENLEVKNITLNLNGNTVFKNLNLLIENGKHYNIILNQGQGKSALCKTFLRFLNVANGQILINGTDYQNIEISSLRQLFSYVTQTSYIFKDSIKNNILMFEDENSEKLKETIKLCGLETLVSKFSNGLEHNLTEKSKEITNQEKQKINLARAIYKDAPVLLIDSAFNVFNDSAKEKLLQNILKKYENRTIIYLSAESINNKNFNKIVIKKKGDTNE